MTVTTTAAAREVARPAALLRDVVLVTVADRPRYGYELAQALGDWRPTNMGQLYRILGRLEATGLVHSEWQQSGAGPSRRVYLLTPTGEFAVAEARAGFERLATILDRYTWRYQVLCRHRHRPGEVAAAEGHGPTGVASQRLRGPGPGPATPEDHGASPPAGAEREVVRRYLEALEAKRRLPASTKQLHANLALLEALVAGANPGVRQQLEERRQDLLAAAAAGSGDGLARAEAAFIAVARAYSAKEAITYAAWAQAGVEARVLHAAGLGPTGAGRSPAPANGDTPCPKPLLRAWLLLLIAEAPSHGLALCETLGATEVARVDPAQVYRVLRRFEGDALVSSQWQVSTRPAPERRVYSLTAAGAEALDACAACVVELGRALRSRMLRPGPC